MPALAITTCSDCHWSETGSCRASRHRFPLLQAEGASPTGIWNPTTPIGRVYPPIEREKRRIYSHLLDQLINLTNTDSVSLPMLVQLVRDRISAESYSLARLLDHLWDSSKANFTFIIALCSSYLEKLSRNTSHGTSGRRTRANPRRIPRNAVSNPGGENNHSADVPNAGSDTALSAPRNYVPPPPSIILSLLSLSDPDNATDCKAAKINLVVNYSCLQKALEPSERDSEWKELIHDGTVLRALEAVCRDETDCDIDMLRKKLFTE